ncbi:MAG: hypothetical protein ACFCBV_07315 [Phycisphaerales bacterium]
MDVPYRVVRHWMGILLLGAHAACLALPSALAAQETTYTLLDEFGGVRYSISSSSSLAVVADTAYRTRWVTWFEDEPPGGEIELWGRFERYGSALTGDQAALMGPYFPALSLQSTTQWSFGKQSFGNNQSGWQIYYPVWASDQKDPAQVVASLPFNGLGMVGPRVESTGTVAPGSYERPAQPNTYPFNATGQDVTVRLRRGVWKAQEPDEASPGKWEFLLFSGAPDLEFEQRDETIFVLSIQPDPFKAAAGDGTFDPDGIISAINDQAAMQQGFFTSWDTVYDKLFEQITGGGTEQDWVTRDQRRDDLLTSIDSSISEVATDVSSIQVASATMVNRLTQILAELQPTQIPPVVTSPGESVATPTLEFSDVESRITNPDGLAPDTWTLPEAPTVAPQSIYSFTVPFGSIPGAVFTDMPISVDVAPYDGYITVAKAVIIVFFTLFMTRQVMAELEKS